MTMRAWRDGDTAGVEPLDGPDEHRGGGDRGFVVVDLGVGDAGAVVDLSVRRQVR